MEMFYTLLTIISNKIMLKSSFIRKNDIEQGLDKPYTISIQYPSQDELDDLV